MVRGSLDTYTVVSRESSPTPPLDIAENRAEYASTGLRTEVEPMHRQRVNARTVSTAPTMTTNLSLCLFLVLWDWSSP